MGYVMILPKAWLITFEGFEEEERKGNEGGGLYPKSAVKKKSGGRKKGLVNMDSNPSFINKLDRPGRDSGRSSVVPDSLWRQCLVAL